MSDLLELAKDINRVYAAGMAAAREAPMVDLSLDPRNVIRQSREVIDKAFEENIALKARVRDLEEVLTRMVTAHEDLQSDSEGRYPHADHGCIECTLGTVPDRLNTGLCAYHKAKQLLAQSQRAREG